MSFTFVLRAGVVNDQM